MKYIIIKAELDGITRHFGFVFAERWTHADFAEYTQDMIAGTRIGNSTSWVRPYKNISVASAGFCHIAGSEYVVSQHGSESLRIAANNTRTPIDQRILNLPDAMQGMV